MSERRGFWYWRGVNRRSRRIEKEYRRAVILRSALIACREERDELARAIEDHTTWTIGAKYDPLTPKADEWRHDQALRAALASSTSSVPGADS